MLKYRHRGHILTPAVLLADAEILFEEILRRHRALKPVVAHRQQLRFQFVEIPAAPTLYLAQRLGIELGVVYWRRHVDGPVEIHTDEAAAPRRVAQHILHVARGDERCPARQFLDGSSPRALHLHRRQLHHILQKSLLQLRRDLVELVQIDEQQFRHRPQHLLLLCQLQTVAISPFQFRRQQPAAERALVETLVGDEQRHVAVAIQLPRLARPLRHHPQKPRVESLPPLRVLRRHRVGKPADMVVAVPAAHTFGEEVADGVETSDEVRPHIVSHVIKPHGDARQLHLQRDSLQRPHVEHQERAVAVPFHILRAFCHRVVSQHIPPPDMLHHPHHM